MKTPILFLLCGISVAQAQQTPPTVRVEKEGLTSHVRVEGSLQPTQRIGCINLSEAKSSMTPPDLHTGLGECLQQGEHEKAFRLFTLAGVFARFDAERIVDTTARGGAQVLVMNTMAAIPAEKKQGLAQVAARWKSDTEFRKLVCGDIQKVGMPSYVPKYLILHGINALTSPNPLENGVRTDFDAMSTWAQLQSTYLKCPA